MAIFIIYFMLLLSLDIWRYIGHALNVIYRHNMNNVLINLQIIPRILQNKRQIRTLLSNTLLTLNTFIDAIWIENVLGRQLIRNCSNSNTTRMGNHDKNMVILCRF